MRLFLALLKKECTIIFRDVHALLALFLLPMVFIIIMSYALKDVANGGKNLKCLYYVSESNSANLSKDFKESISKLQDFQCKESISDKLTRDSDLLMVVPSDFFDSFGNDENNSISVQISYQPALNQTTLYLFEALLKERIILLYTNQTDGEFTPVFVKNLSKSFINSMPSSQKIPNSVEQSVPAWIVFAMFFILIPLSTVFIVEKEQSTYKRLKSVGVSQFLFFSAKMVSYNIVNMLQGIILLLVGVFIIPIFGMEALSIGNIFAALILLFSLSCAAIGFALFIASICKSSSQAVIVGGISNILFGAIGGIMVPKYIMPPIMQQFSNISPMSWGFDAFIKIILDKAGVVEIVQNVIFLLFFGMIMLLISLYLFAARKGE